MAIDLSDRCSCSDGGCYGRWREDGLLSGCRRLGIMKISLLGMTCLRGVEALRPTAASCISVSGRSSVGSG